VTPADGRLRATSAALSSEQRHARMKASPAPARSAPTMKSMRPLSRLAVSSPYGLSSERICRRGWRLQHRGDRQRQQLRARQRQRADRHHALTTPASAAMSSGMWRSSASTRSKRFDPAPAGVGRQHAVRGAQEQRLAQHVFQPRDGLADRRLRGAHRMRDARHVVDFGQQRGGLQAPLVEQRFDAADLAPLPGRAGASSRTSCSSASMRSARSRTTSPAAVSSMPLPLRSNSCTSSCSSSADTERATADEARYRDSRTSGGCRRWRRRREGMQMAQADEVMVAKSMNR
jgi:hypothetical protein